MIPGGADDHPQAPRVVRPGRAAHPSFTNRQDLPLIVETALSVLIASAPETAHDAANTVKAYFQPSDDCPPHGMPRPT
jgi:hypothetical protein